MTSAEGRGYEYDIDNRLVRVTEGGSQVKAATYDEDATLRTLVSATGQTIRRCFAPEFEVNPQSGEIFVHYFFAGRRAAWYDTAVHYLRSDHLSSTDAEVAIGSTTPGKRNSGAHDGSNPDGNDYVYRFQTMAWTSGIMEASVKLYVPQDVDVGVNIRDAADLRVHNAFTGGSELLFLASTLPAFNEWVKTGGRWDFKQQGEEYEPFGNFHYGVVGKAAGIPEQPLLRAAGWAQQETNAERMQAGKAPVITQGTPWDIADSAYGDARADSAMIKLGFRFYDLYMATRPSYPFFFRPF